MALLQERALMFLVDFVALPKEPTRLFLADC